MYYLETISKPLWLSLERQFKNKISGFEFLKPVIKDDGELDIYFNCEDAFLRHKLKLMLSCWSIGWDFGRRYEQNKRVKNGQR